MSATTRQLETGLGRPSGTNNKRQPVRAGATASRVGRLTQIALCLVTLASQSNRGPARDYKHTHARAGLVCGRARARARATVAGQSRGPRECGPAPRGGGARHRGGVSGCPATGETNAVRAFVVQMYKYCRQTK